MTKHMQDGSATQIIVALLLAFGSLLVMNEIKPYIDPLDDRLAQMALCVTILILIGSIMLFNGNTEEDGYNEDVLGGVMVFVSASLIVVSAAFQIYSTCADARIRNLKELEGAIVDMQEESAVVGDVEEASGDEVGATEDVQADVEIQEQASGAAATFAQQDDEAPDAVTVAAELASPEEGQPGCGSWFEPRKTESLPRQS